MKTNNKNLLIIISSILIGLLLGWLFFSNSGDAEHEHQHTSAEESSIWTCSMHPQIRQEEPGSCPLCGMDLISLDPNAATLETKAITMTDYAMKLANVQTMEVGIGKLDNEIRVNGKIEVDDRLVSTQSSHISGRIEQLSVNFTGEEVTQGQVLAWIYSPQLVTAQEELLQAFNIRASQPELFEAAKSKLRSWRIDEDQINRILETQQTLDQFPVIADVSGVVTEKLVELGDYVERGSPIYKIADLSKVWVQFDVYERSMGAIAEGSLIKFNVASQPGVEYQGRVSFVDPLVDSQTRVSKVRVEISNKEGLLKPGMLVSGTAEISDSATSGKLSIPGSAVLWTGERSVVYVKTGEGSFTLREVILGNSIGDAYIIREGLRPGEEVVVNGAFTVDAAAQLAGKPSMMNPGDTSKGTMSSAMDLEEFLEVHTGEFKSVVPEEFQQKLYSLTASYLKLKDNLIAGIETENPLNITKFQAILGPYETELHEVEAESFWKARKQQLIMWIEQIEDANTLKERRNAFEGLSNEMIMTIAAFGTGGHKIYVDYCPMADSDSGAYWLSEAEDIKNPYFGEAMLTCGEIVTEIK